MFGSRPLTLGEQRQLVSVAKKLPPRNRALICAQLFLGFRISEVLALNVGHVVHDGKIARRVTLPPRLLKGAYGGTRSIPVGPALADALRAYLENRGQLRLIPRDEPLFLSREKGPSGQRRLGRSSAEKIIRRILRSVFPHDPQGLSTHSLRKSWALRLYEASGHDLLMVRDGLGHSSVAITQLYLPVNRAHLERLIQRGDWTHGRSRRRAA